MSNLIINQSSNKYAISSLGIALFLLMFFFSFLFIGNQLSTRTQSLSVLVFDLNEGHEKNATEQIVDKLKSINDIHVMEVKFIPKTDAVDYFKDDLDAETLAKLHARNPFRNVVKITMDEAMNNQQKHLVRSIAAENDELIKHVNIHTSGRDEDHVKKGYSMIVLPFLILCIFFCISVVAGTISSDLSLNKIEINRSIIGGVNPKLLYKNIGKNMFRNFLKSVILAIVLFIMTFYLIRYHLNLNFSEFGFYNLLKPIFISILLTGIGVYMIVHYKVSSFLKSI